MLKKQKIVDQLQLEKEAALAQLKQAEAEGARLTVESQNLAEQLKQEAM